MLEPTCWPDFDKEIKTLYSLYYYMGIKMWGEYFSYRMTMRKFLESDNPFMGKGSNIINDMKTVIEFININKSSNDLLSVHSVIENKIELLFYWITREISFNHEINNDLVRNKYYDLFAATEKIVTGIIATEQTINPLLINMYNDYPEWKDESQIINLGQSYFSFYKNLGIEPYDLNGNIEFKLID